ncbi:uncharacterized protein LOC122064578 [Macadamia integrifolia]|uniref:uncharacterized protein LOC122064578 n=1 Tax=Macadamia integrifolia TaxID=60698 RepID=UPI001C4F8C46|nr:uncharacterized protein LOC122064578 [Macadamia integrifolia]XP_042484238.1 uncharacterized protein LOC122064578 [Macadamia integrifolia]XP_042484239.1 uncharacterized protein LOC122064578 [Macadamia integrifolia]XP_042484240.1 uncharacterized protein LOC122064578 [Macadamia integrifolia]XP_042484241.1 uncharacterized protein LOC122064578 [Macadamia integrifolia]
MDDARDELMDLDLNLGPSVPLSPNYDPDLGPLSAELGNMEEHIRQLEAVAVRARHRWRWRQGRVPAEVRSIPVEMIVSSGSSARLQTGEGSVAAEDRTTSDSNKVCKGNASDLLAKALGSCNEPKKSSGSGDGGSFFECNICLDVARNPVLTCCGHLFCWPCLYQWLHIHSDTKECPVCKGEVTDMNITPIYSRGNDTQESEKEDESGVKVPPRPHARRVESLRQWIHRAVQIEDSYFAQMIRRIGNRFDVMGEWPPPPDLDAADEMRDRPNSLSNWIPSTRRREGSGRYSIQERNFGRPEQDFIDLTQGYSGSSESEGSRQLPSLRSVRSQRTAAASISHISSAERLVQAYFLGRPMGRNQTHNPPVEDRDSVSSIAAVIQSESQTLDNTAEIESMMSLSSSSSRRRTDASRASYVDSGISRATRRRRLI